VQLLLNFIQLVSVFLLFLEVVDVRDNGLNCGHSFFDSWVAFLISVGVFEEVLKRAKVCERKESKEITQKNPLYPEEQWVLANSLHWLGNEPIQANLVARFSRLLRVDLSC
jgi:hypothetical protein